MGIFYRKKLESKDPGNPKWMQQSQCDRDLRNQSFAGYWHISPEPEVCKKRVINGGPSEFESTLAQLAEVIQTYESSHDIVHCGVRYEF